MSNRQDIEKWLKANIQNLTEVLVGLKNPNFDNQDALDNINEIIEDFQDEINLLEIEYDLELQRGDEQEEEEEKPKSKKKKSECHPRTYLRDSL